MRKNKFWIFNLFAISALFIVGCSAEYETSNITGWDYNNPKNGGFLHRHYDGHPKDSKTKLIHLSSTKNEFSTTR